ncbi:hypothetical protein DXG01_011809 [Tephrocybe rancida]|nr:hypothetical protein DXG01_011809 [Tephrocybe rancida]
MSRIKQSMLSTTHLIFHGLQDHVCRIIANLPENVNARLKSGLLAAHQKLREYYYQFDQSPFYTWAALLDPHIMYHSLKEEYADNDDLLMYLKTAKQKLCEYYRDHYASHLSTPSQIPSTLPSTKFSFTECFQNKSRQVLDELDDYFKQVPEPFDDCRPLQWGLGRRAQYPNLYQLMRDILAIPGSAVAVERIFLGGCDTISLRRASLSLQPDAI